MPRNAIEALRRLAEKVSDEPELRDGIVLAIRQFEEFSKLGTRIPIIFRPSSGETRLAELCYQRGFFAASATIWFSQFAADPSLAQDIEAGDRFNAACSAALAASGEGSNKSPLEQTTKTTWRQRALEWLKADLAYLAKQLESKNSEVKDLIRQTLRQWKAHRDLASVRDEKALAELPDSERKDWQAFWSEVAALLKKAD